GGRGGGGQTGAGSLWTAADNGRVSPVARSTRTSSVTPYRPAMPAAQVPSGEGSADETSASLVTRRTSPLSTSHRYRSQRSEPSKSGARREKRTRRESGIHPGFAGGNPVA